MEGASVGEQKNAGNGMFAALYCQVLPDFHCLFGSRKGPTTDILHTIHHVYRSTRAAREAKARFGEALECSVHDCETAWLILMLTWIY